ncbi:MAG TPA: DNA repair protein RecN [Bacteroidales bacterium]|nr:DNA repair protein RecN [Bacteroidales bacterium]HPS17822.1 DNA repair protein RecN [Bacteroidales bacterium]
MLSHLSINNYVLIEKLEISFSEGLSIITGETGAGKSILLGALSLVLGQRADMQVLYDKTKKCFIEAAFKIKGYDLNSFFERNELDYDDNTVLRREVGANGKTRAFINDTPVTLELIRELGNMLIDIHSQHKTLTLQDSHFQLSYVDGYAQHDNLLNDFYKEFIIRNQLKLKLYSLEETEKKSLSDKDYFQFQFDELDSAKLLNNEQTELESELAILNHAEEIQQYFSNASASLTEGEQNIYSGISEIFSLLNKASALYPAATELAKRMESCKIEIKDIADEIELLSLKINHDPSRQQEISERLDVIYRLQQKHRVNTVDELLVIMNDYSEKLLSITSLTSQIEKIKKEIEASENILKTVSEKISKNRKKSIVQIEKGVTSVLQKLGMPNAEFEIECFELPDYNAFGQDKVTFLFNANKGGEKKEVSKVASGGELSRLMLAIKSLISQKKLLPTIIFDEIDQGVSGEIADKVGSIMKNMSDTMQVITITHLPQIASKGDSHFLVYKESDKKSAFTKIKLLEKNERISEIAKMLSGDELTKAAVENAKVLLKTKN